MRTQTEMIIQRQNRNLLRSMNSRARQQLRLQQTVERLSIAAVTYYPIPGSGLSAIWLRCCHWSSGAGT